MEEKHKQIECLETVKKMNAAKAKVQVYQQEVGSDQEISELLHDSKHWQEIPAPNSRSLSVHHMTQAVTREQPAINVYHEQSNTALASAIAESINATISQYQSLLSSMTH